jgi:hypothetical protein
LDTESTICFSCKRWARAIALQVAVDAGYNDLQAPAFVLAGIGKFKQAAADKNLYAVGALYTL